MATSSSQIITLACVYVMRLFKLYKVSNVQVHHGTVHQSHHTVHYIPGTILLIIESLYPLTTSSPFCPSLQPLATTVLVSVSVSLAFLDSTYA